MKRISFDLLRHALADAGSAHHDYEQHVLDGVRDELWPGFYAAFVLGRLGSFTSASMLSRLLEQAPSDGDWATGAAGFVIHTLESETQR